VIVLDIDTQIARVKDLIAKREEIEAELSSILDPNATMADALSFMGTVIATFIRETIWAACCSRQALEIFAPCRPAPMQTPSFTALTDMAGSSARTSPPWRPSP
jgi:hypothetical protein